jgi:hypothetical protein
MTWADAGELTETFAARVAEYDRAETAALCRGLIARARVTEEPFPAEEAEKVLGMLRRKRWFDLIAEVGDAFIQTGVTSPTVRRHYAQALLDQGHLVAGGSVLRALVTETLDVPKENAQARGLLGRAYKQAYMDAAAPALARNQALLRKSIEAYYEVYKADPDPWHGINTAALLARARRDGVAAEGYPEAEELAGTIRADIEKRSDEGHAGVWDFATALEASVALHDYEGALEWLGRYVASDSDSFELSSTLRQLEEVWQLEAAGAQGAILEILRGAILAREDGGTIDLQPKARATAVAALESVSEPTLERVLGTTGVQNLKWYRTGLDRSEAVALLCDSLDSGIGTGFLLRGADLCDQLPADEVFVITNAHVVSNEVSGALRPDEAVIKFEALGLGGEFRIAELIFSSPPEELDVSVLRIDKPAPDVPPIPVASGLPLADGEQRVYIIGHPRGGGLSFSLQDNLLLDLEDPRLHYRAPTEPGSSGSPVFDSKWRLIGLHHAGGMTMPKLHDKEGRYAANEGLWIQSIRAALARHLGGAAT